MKLIDLINQAEKCLAASGIESAKLDAEVLLAHVIGCGRAELYINREKKLSSEQIEKYSSFIDRRAGRSPVAYITGVKEFWSMPIKVTQDVLIPRPETELVVEQAVKLLKTSDEKRATRNERQATRNERRFLDLCTGSGCIAAALAKEFPNARITVTDISEKAIAIARENLSFAANRTEFLCGNLFEPLKRENAGFSSNERRATSDGFFDLIAANPPYVSEDDRGTLGREITEYEPETALYGGKCGLDFASKIIEDSVEFIKPGGWLVMEMGIGQADKLMRLARSLKKYSAVSVSKDLAGIERVICCGV